MVSYPCAAPLTDLGRNIQDGVHVQRGGKQTSGHHSPHEAAGKGLTVDSDCTDHQRVRMTWGKGPHLNFG